MAYSMKLKKLSIHNKVKLMFEEILEEEEFSHHIPRTQQYSIRQKLDIYANIEELQ